LSTLRTDVQQMMREAKDEFKGEVSCLEKTLDASQLHAQELQKELHLQQGEHILLQKELRAAREAGAKEKAKIQDNLSASVQEIEQLKRHVMRLENQIQAAAREASAVRTPALTIRRAAVKELREEMKELRDEAEAAVAVMGKGELAAKDGGDNRAGGDEDKGGGGDGRLLEKEGSSVSDDATADVQLNNNTDRHNNTDRQPSLGDVAHNLSR
jgi:septal ring factor EnvC (AmiA/AmiB activator)